MKAFIYYSPGQGFWHKPLFAVLAIFLFAQCKKDAPEEINDEEVINRVTITLSNSQNTPVIYTWNEGERIPTLSLVANEVYQASIAFFDASDPAEVENITEEVIEEADEHFVFYEVSGANLTITSASNDTVDSDGVSINVYTQWTTGAPSSGVIRTYLVHEPTTKSGSTRSALGGASDVELDFPVNIQ
ncbi:hypothetical protein N9575_02280 [Flavobacteriaceae bacterium]|nr:hypothetical protein [Flavobacteriaceae bacterium]MDB4118351.1 hypothetical protein [Flavobacteriaceae bacterium]